MIQNSNQNATICSKRIQSQIRNLVGHFSVKCLLNGFISLGGFYEWNSPPLGHIEYSTQSRLEQLLRFDNQIKGKYKVRNSASRSHIIKQLNSRSKNAINFVRSKCLISITAF